MLSVLNIISYSDSALWKQQEQGMIYIFQVRIHPQEKISNLKQVNYGMNELAIQLKTIRSPNTLKNINLKVI